VNFINPGDALVLNDTKVIKAKLTGHKYSGAKIEVLLVKEKHPGVYEVLLNPAKRLKIGDSIIFRPANFSAKVLDKKPCGISVIEFSPPDIAANLEKLGRPPLPHYIKKDIDDFAKYQTVYAKKEGAIAAPTAGLHFSPQLLSQLEAKGAKIAYVTLHCGLATFRPVTSEDIRNHKIETETIEVSNNVAQEVNQAKKEGFKVIAVGTTSIRSLESASFTDPEGKAQLKPFGGETNLYITPGYKFKITDTVLTNFHTPCSTNLILISSFCGLTLLKQAYDYALREKFRFFSFGDAMLIV
jgi:S-adenosylmethionine:tRNA ribosyltransferase-isomerase